MPPFINTDIIDGNVVAAEVLENSSSEEDDEIEESREEKSGNGDSPEIGATRPSQNNAWGFAANAQSKTCVISGLTGSGKTRVLAALAQRGERVIDLEGLANHCGSAFGWV